MYFGYSQLAVKTPASVADLAPAGLDFNPSRTFCPVSTFLYISIESPSSLAKNMTQHPVNTINTELDCFRNTDVGNYTHVVLAS